MNPNLKSIINRICQKDNEYIESILSSDDNNQYKQRLTRIANLINTNQIDEKSASMLINSIIGDYYFDVVMPKEDEEIRQIREYEQYRQKNNIPLFDDVTEGQTWNGGRRMANLIKDLKLTPKPAGKRTRISQDKNIKRYCELLDDEETKTLTLNKIYKPDEIKPKTKKEYKKKYEAIAMLVLMKLCDTNYNGVIRTTRQNLLKQIIEVVSQQYNQIPVDFYKAIIPENELNIEHLKTNLKIFHEVCSERFKNIVNNVLDMLEMKSLIKYRSYPVIVTKDENGIKKYTSMYDSESLNLNKGELAKMMLDAEHFSANQITVNVYNENLMKYELKKLQNIDDIIKHFKKHEYLKHFNKFIKNNYGWEYVFEAIEITLTSNQKYIKTILQDNFNNNEYLQSISNELINKAVQKTIETKVKNKEKSYNQACNNIIKKALENPEINDYFDLNIINESDLINDFYLFKYFDDLTCHSDYFAKYEISKNNLSDFNQWKLTQLKNKYNKQLTN